LLTQPLIQSHSGEEIGVERMLVRAVTEHIGGIDILIHNVGGSAARGGGVLALSYLIDSICCADVSVDKAFLRSTTLHGPSCCYHLTASSAESIDNGCADTASSTGYLIRLPWNSSPSADLSWTLLLATPYYDFRTKQFQI
jgi:hypothetical protein